MRSSNPELACQLSPAGAVAPAHVQERPEFDWTITLGHQAAIPARLVAFTPGKTPEPTQLLLDENGHYYAVDFADRERQTERTCQLTGKEAMQWIVGRFITEADKHILGELKRAIENPEFEFMPYVPAGKRKPRARRARNTAPGPFAVQLEMATAFVECVRKLDADPSIVHLADACRAASKLHQAIHAPEAFKKAGVV